MLYKRVIYSDCETIVMRELDIMWVCELCINLKYINAKININERWSGNHVRFKIMTVKD